MKVLILAIKRASPKITESRILPVLSFFHPLIVAASRVLFKNNTNSPQKKHHKIHCQISSDIKSIETIT